MTTTAPGGGAHLTAREAQILSDIVKGFPNTDIARRQCSASTPSSPTSASPTARSVSRAELKRSPGAYRAASNPATTRIAWRHRGPVAAAEEAVRSVRRGEPDPRRGEANVQPP
jgi:hypothetical protein